MTNICASLVWILILTKGISSQTAGTVSDINETLPLSRSEDSNQELKLDSPDSQNSDQENVVSKTQDYSTLKTVEDSSQPQSQEETIPQSQDDVVPKTQESVLPQTPQNDDGAPSRLQDNTPRTPEDIIPRHGEEITPPIEYQSLVSELDTTVEPKTASSSTPSPSSSLHIITTILNATGQSTNENANMNIQNKTEFFERENQTEILISLTTNFSQVSTSTTPEIMSITTAIANDSTWSDVYNATTSNQSSEVFNLTIGSNQIADLFENTTILEKIVESTQTSTTRLSPDLLPSRNNIATSKKQIVLLLQKDCNERNGLPKSFADLDDNLRSLFRNGNKGVHITNHICETYVHLKFTISSVNEHVIAKATDLLSRNVTLGDFKILQAIEADDNLDTSNLLKVLLVDERDNSDELLKQKEIIAYIVAALSAGLLLLIFIVFCCIRCLSHKQTNSLDLCDIPHLNLKVEDYKMTPIPRPSISYQEYGRELLNSSYGRSNSGRSEDMILNQQHFTGDGMSSLSNTLRRETLPGRNEMRTFNGKKGCSRVQSMDIRPNRSNDNWMSNSRERLNTDFERKNMNGFDNPTFRRWY